MKPYYEEDGITIYHGDCREVLPVIVADDAWIVGQRPDVIVTDPPYGINGMRAFAGDGTSKGDYQSEHFDDTPEYVRAVVVPIITNLRRSVPRAVLTPGQINIHKYPEPEHIGVFYYPTSMSISRWGMRLWQPIFYYGKDPYPNKLREDSRICYDSDRITDHPCPKPIGSWKWLVGRASVDGDLVLDPFMGSGTTLRAAKDLGRRAIGIEIEEKYCEIAAKRLAQKVLQF